MFPSQAAYPLDCGQLICFFIVDLDWSLLQQFIQQVLYIRYLKSVRGAIKDTTHQ